MDLLLKFSKSKFDTLNYTHNVQYQDKNIPIKVDEKDLDEFWDIIRKCEDETSIKWKVSERFPAEPCVIVQIDKKEDLSLDQKRKLVSSLQFSVQNCFKIDEDKLLTTLMHDESETITMIMPYVKVPYNSLRKEIREALIYILDQKKVLSEDQSHNIMVTKSVYDGPFWISRPLDELEVFPAIDAENVKTVVPGTTDDMPEEEPEKLLSFSSFERPTLERNLTSANNRKVLTHSELVAERIKEKSKSDLEIVLELLQFLDKSRCNTQSGFKDIGQCLFNISHGDGKGLLIWKQIASGTSAEEDCEKFWPTFERTNTSLGTFRYWCAQDDPEGYISWKENHIRTYLWMCLNPTAGHTDVAMVLHKMYQDRFVCGSIKDQRWFEFRGHKYEELDGGVTLRILLSREVVKKFEELLNECNLSQKSAPEGLEKDKWDRKQEVCKQVIIGLKNSAYKTNIMREASEIFYDPTFCKTMNQNKKIFVLQNGVLDLDLVNLKTHPNTWIRDGRPEDKSTMCAGVAYKSFTEDDPEVKQVRLYFRKVFVDDAIRNYVLRLLASCLEGGNKEKICPVFSGTGNNSKSILESIIEKLWWDYCAKPPTSLITARERTSPDAATPAFETMRYSRIAIFQEPKSGSTINDSVLKELTGNDTMYSRALNKMPEKIIPQFTTLIICNKIPQTDGSDPAIMNRIRIIEFLSTFARKGHYPETEEEQWATKTFPIDLDFDSKIQGMLQPLLWILIQEYAKYKTEGLPTPEVVTLATQVYKEKNDTFAQFLAEKFEIIKEEKEKELNFIKSDAAYQCYKRWLDESYPGSKVPDKEDFKENMKRRGYKMKNMKYYGIKMVAI